MFPGLFPNLLANGASGIAVGMATSIPPHNAAELIDAAITLIDNPKADDAALMDFVAGPGLSDRRAAGRQPGGDRRGLCDRARQLPRARALDRVEREKGGGWHLVVTRDPVRRAEGQADRADRRADQRQEAADPGRRARRDATRRSAWCSSRAAARSIPTLLMESLFRLTDLEMRVPLNLNVLDKTRTPRRDEPASRRWRAWVDAPVRRAAAARAAPARQDRRPDRAARRVI